MKSFLYILLFVIFIFLLLTIFIKTTNHFIKAVDPLAQQIVVIDNSRSLEIKKIKGELVKALINNYYNHNIDSFSTLKKK